MHNFIAISWQSRILDRSLDVLVDPSDIYKWTPQIAELLSNMVISEIDIVHGPEPPALPPLVPTDKGLIIAPRPPQR